MRLKSTLTAMICLCAQALPLAALDIKSVVLRIENEAPLPISRLDLPPEDLGFAGGDLATKDNATTGGFLGQNYSVEHVSVAPDAVADEVARQLAEGATAFAVLGDAATLKEISDVIGDQALVINALSEDNDLRDGECRPNMLHVAPSYSMRSDALTQYLVWKKWTDLALITGSHDVDKAWGEALKGSATKFGLRLRNELEFEDTGGARRTDTGHVLVQKQMPVFTQSIKKADVVMVADESEVFGAYLPYHTWNATPVVGSAGLTPTSWHPALEAWGATQFQRRFEKEFGRYMRPEDYQTWLALRVLGEAVTRTSSNAPNVLMDYILSDDFEMAGFKGEKLTFRNWNGQLRQPVLLANDKLIVSVSPQEGFLHPVSLLDTMGLDAPESDCTAFNRDG